jgi:hypothetical protein
MPKTSLVGLSTQAQYFLAVVACPELEGLAVEQPPARVELLPACRLAARRPLRPEGAREALGFALEPIGGS